jgi:hypothetical protein
VSLLCISKSSSGTREVNATPSDGYGLGKVENMPAEAVEWRFKIKRDIIVTLMLRAGELGP